MLAQKSPHGGSFRTSCGDCHKTDGWKVDLNTVSFDHKETKFPLVGQHQAVNCKDCHTSLEFAKARPECNSCHTDIHEQTVGNECARCHTPNSWMVTSITQLHQQSRFPLIGPHTVADCKECHKNLLDSDPAAGTASRLRFDPLGVECYDCHKNNYIGTTSPNHVKDNYSTNCDECHKMNYFSWTGASINHTFYPLEGKHSTTPCTSCHPSGYVNTPNTCAGCHINEYNQTTNPNHTTSLFPTTCEACHTPSGWSPSTFDHTSVYPLTGAHETTACTSCHTNGYANTPNTCAGCHTDDYNRTTNPNHTAGHYPNTCADCHTTSAWTPSTWDHTAYFPISKGDHNVSCATCHTNPANYAVFTCVTPACHADAHYQNQGSVGCYSCHPTGEGD